MKPTPLFIPKQAYLVVLYSSFLRFSLYTFEHPAP